MRPKIDFYLKLLIKQHLPYFIVLIVLIFITVLLPASTLKKYNDNRHKLSQLKPEVDELKFKNSILEAVASQEGLDINRDKVILDRLIPSIEDFFSVILAVDEISKQTNFNIVSSNIIIKSIAPSEKLTLSLNGAGDLDSFINFLENYNFAGKRLVTIDRYDLKITGDTFNLNANANFYHKDTAEVSSKKIDYQKTLNRLRALRQIINIEIDESEQVNEFNYPPTKSNPF
jgi:hypothetical protein